MQKSLFIVQNGDIQGDAGLQKRDSIVIFNEEYNEQHDKAV